MLNMLKVERQGALLDLLYELVVRDMKLRYKRSMLGFAWSLLNPLAQLAIFCFLFRLVLPLDIPNYPLFVFTGLLSWNWLQMSLVQATGAITDNRELIRRPGFWPAVLPMVPVTSQLVHFGMALPVLLIFVLFSGGSLNESLGALPLVLSIQFAFTLGLGYMLATLHVRFRDTQYMLGVLLMLLFYMTPVFYDLSFVPERFRWVYQLNPMVHLVGSYRSILVEGQWPPVLPLLILTVVSAGLVTWGYRIFMRTSDRFVEEL